MKLILLCFLLILSACEGTLTDCEFKPSATVNNDFDIEKPLQDQIQPETKVTCTY
jgi:hypothetical protein